MLESLVRGNLPRLQRLYDRVPSPARHLLTTTRGWFLTQIRYSAETFAFLRELREHESWSAAQVAAHQLAALRRAADHARRTVPYAANYPRFEIRSVKDLARLPILDRETALLNQERLLSQTTPAHRRIRAGTTGTTGASLQVAYTESLARRNWAFMLRQWAWAGVAPLHPRITLQGQRIVPAKCKNPPYWTYNVPEHQILMSIFHLSEQTAPSYLDFLYQRRGRVLEGFPSVLGILADFALERGLRIPMRVVFTSGEPLYPHVRAKIEDAFQARVFDSYGMTEYCGLTQECERGRMHLAPEYGFLEILNDNDEPSAPDEEGNFVWTGFLNEAMPLLRYRIGDRGRWQSAGTCPCGRSFPVVVPTITRESDILRCPDGRLFSPRALNQLLKQSDSLRFCQFIHSRRNHITVRAVPRSGQSNHHVAEEMMQIRAELQALLGPSVQVTAELARAPVSRAGGKIPLIVNEASQ